MRSYRTLALLVERLTQVQIPASHGHLLSSTVFLCHAHVHGYDGYDGHTQVHCHPRLRTPPPYPVASAVYDITTATATPSPRPCLIPRLILRLILRPISDDSTLRLRLRLRSRDRGRWSDRLIPQCLPLTLNLTSDF